MSAATLRTVRDTLLLAARDARYRPHADLAPGYVTRARQINRKLLQLAREVRHVAR
jgi:hypothetical protein